MIPMDSGRFLIDSFFFYRIGRFLPKPGQLADNYKALYFYFRCRHNVLCVFERFWGFQFNTRFIHFDDSDYFSNKSISICFALKPRIHLSLP